MAGDPLEAWLKDDDGWERRRTAAPPRPDGAEEVGWGSPDDPWAAGGDGPDEDPDAGPAWGRGSGPVEQEDYDRFLLSPEPEPRRGRRLWRLVLLPWLAAAVLAVVAIGASRGEPAPGNQDRPAPSSASPIEPLLPDGAAGRPVPDPGDDSDLRAAAAVAVRNGLSGSTGAGDGVRYVDLALGESVSWTGQDTAVVTVVAVVLDGSGGRWQEARTARYAVPLQRRDGRAVALAPPWPLPIDDAAPPPGAWEPIAAPELAEPVVAALTDAGYDPIGGVELSRDPTLAGVLRARLEAVAPGEPAARVHELWLRDGSSPVLLGHEPGTPPRPSDREPLDEPGGTAASPPADRPSPPADTP